MAKVNGNNLFDLILFAFVFNLPMYQYFFHGI